MSKILFFIAGALFLLGCKKQLDVKPDKSLIIPSTAEDLQALLDNVYYMNLVHSATGEISADNYYVTNDNYNTLSTITAKDLYTWQNDVFNDYDDLTDWFLAYRTIYYANTVLEGIEKLENKASANAEKIKASALFYRSLSFYELAGIFCKAYKVDSNINDLGIPLRLESDINKKYKRATLKETYDQIIKDLIIAAENLPLMPENGYKTRPGKPAAYALLARVYLSIQDYDNALKYASQTLEIYNTLLDFNTDINANSSTAPIARYNKETIFFAQAYDWGIVNFSRAFIDTSLLKEYDSNDIRKTAFFRLVSGNYIFKGTYTGSRFQLIFTGLATGEVYLIRAECYARKGELLKALDDLNTLLVKRYKKGTFIPVAAENSLEALQKILTERRKELVFRSLRWSDLKRLNQDQRFAKTLVRNVNDKQYTLQPRDERYVLPIPLKVIKAGGIEPN